MSSAQSSQESVAVTRPEPQKTSFAFLVHSTDTLTNNLPPTVDNKSLARQKRRRTSPEDQAILESEYSKNPKPDKAARMDIVRRVALGEKEVQIWFQNRRQSSRRKSRPLLPHEIAQYQTSRPNSGDFSMSTPDLLSQSFSANSQASDGQEDGEEGLTLEENVPPSTTDRANVDAADNETTSDTVFLATDLPPSQAIPSSQESTGGRLDYLANRRSTAPRPSQEDVVNEVMSASQASMVDQPARRELRKSSSVVRLSMTSDGVARIVTEGDSSPSPPRTRPIEVQTSTTTYTEQGETTDNSVRSTRAPLIRRPSGRSRDSRAWEFWCDRDARSELEEKADQENSGSAADAIGLIRSNSGRNILGSLIGKRDSPFRESTSAKRSRTSRTPLLQRSQSLQNKQISRTLLGGKSLSNTSGKIKKAVSGLGIQMLGTDSDKENWSPERIVPASEHSIRTIETDDSNPVDASAALSVTMKTRAAASGRDDSPDDEDDDVERPRRRGRESKSNSVSEEEELDCVQGLLSLSQGNWR